MAKKDCAMMRIKPCGELNEAIEEAQRRHHFFKKVYLSKEMIVLISLREHYIKEGLIPKKA